MTRTTIPLLLVLLTSSLLAQDPPGPDRTGTPDATANARQDKATAATDGLMKALSQPEFLQVDLGDGVLHLAGNVEVEINGRYIRCDNLVAWLDLDRKQKAKPDGPDGKPTGEDQLKEYVKEIYAEGNVVHSRGDEWTHADRLFLDIRKERGLAIDATASIPLATRDGDMPVVVRAAELRILSRDRVAGSGVQTWVSRFGRPFTNLTSDEIEIIRELQAPGNPNDPNRPENYHIRTEGNVMRLGTFPVMWLPDFAGDTASRRNSLLIESVRYNSSNEFGQQLGVTLGDDIETGDGRRWGHWQTHLDWFSRRGPSVGVDLVYNTDEYRGIFFSRYIRDGGNDENFGTPPTRNRGRVSWWHRHMLPGGIQLDTELQLFSDRGFYPTWHEDQFKGLKPPENLVFVKKAFFNSMVTGLVSSRFNDWLTQVEHQPQLRYDLIAEPLFDIAGHPLYYTVSAQGGKARIEFDEDTKTEPLGTWRVDVDNLVQYAILLDPFKITPFVGARYSYYEKDINRNENQDRVGLTYGATLNMQSWKSFSANGGIFNLDGLRHVIIPEVTFRNTIGVDLRPAELIPIDELETFDNTQVFEFRLRNLFQTLRHRPVGTQVDTFIDIELEMDYFPNPRDNDDNPFGNLDADILVRFRDDLQFIADFEVNWYGKGFEVGNAAIGYTPSRDFQSYAGFRHYHETYDAIFVQANWRIDEKWLASVESSYDFAEGRGIDHRVVFTRIGPEWVFRAGFRFDLGEDEFSVIVSFDPRFLFDPVLRSGQLRSEPRLLFLGSGFGK